MSGQGFDSPQLHTIQKEEKCHLTGTSLLFSLLLVKIDLVFDLTILTMYDHF